MLSTALAYGVADCDTKDALKVCLTRWLQDTVVTLTPNSSTGY